MCFVFEGQRYMLNVSREISWRKVRFNWHFKVHHLPTEKNTVADALSRLFAPHAALMPEVLRSEFIQRRQTPAWSDVWQAWVEAPAHV